MPAFLVPRKSTVHRLAAIALYRALLTQCSALPKQRDELQNIVRNRFRQSQHVHSARRLRVSFEAGYEAVDRLDAAVSGDEAARGYITGLLERAPAKVKQAPAVKQRKEAKEVDAVAEKEKISLFDRPLPLEKLKGKRHVPVLFSANHIPILRLKKPQPESLSRFIRQRIEQRGARHDLRFALYEQLKVAGWEDEWDGLTAELTGQEHQAQGSSMREAMLGAKVKKEEEPTWKYAVDAAITEVHGQLGEEREKNRVTAEKMQAVVDRERELFEKEKAEREEAKRVEKLRRWEERKQTGLHVLGMEQEVDKEEPMAMAK